MKWIYLAIAMQAGTANAQEVHFPDGMKHRYLYDSVFVPLSGKDHGFQQVAYRGRPVGLQYVHYSEAEDVIVLVKVTLEGDIVGLKSRNQVTNKNIQWHKRRWWYDVWRNQYDRLGETDFFPSRRENKKRSN